MVTRQFKHTDTSSTYHILIVVMGHVNYCLVKLIIFYFNKVFLQLCISLQSLLWYVLLSGRLILMVVRGHIGAPVCLLLQSEFCFLYLLFSGKKNLIQVISRRTLQMFRLLKTWSWDPNRSLYNQVELSSRSSLETLETCLGSEETNAGCKIIIFENISITHSEC